MSSPTVTGDTPRIGTDENPLIHPVTGERLVFTRRAAAIRTSCWNWPAP